MCTMSQANCAPPKPGKQIGLGNIEMRIIGMRMSYNNFHLILTYIYGQSIGFAAAPAPPEIRLGLCLGRFFVRASIIDAPTCSSTNGNHGPSKAITMRHRFITILLWILALSAQIVTAQTTPDPEQQRRLAGQKLKLVEMLVNSPTAQASSASTDAETAALIVRSKELLTQARGALAAQRYADAAQALDEALRSVSKANSRNAGGLSESIQKQRLQEMSEQVASYRAALAELAKLKGGAAHAQPALQRVDALADEGRKLAAAGHLGNANKKMAEAYKLSVEEIARLREGQEVVIALKFETPAEEYAYEQKRFNSNEILVGMMIAEGRAEGDKRRLVDGFMKEAARIKEDAAGLARSNRHRDAVAAMEKAVTQLNRALQSMGVPVF